MKSMKINYLLSHSPVNQAVLVYLCFLLFLVCIDHTITTTFINTFQFKSTKLNDGPDAIGDTK